MVLDKHMKQQNYLNIFKGKIKYLLFKNKALQLRYTTTLQVRYTTTLQVRYTTTDKSMTCL